MQGHEVSAKADALTGLMEKHLGARGKTLEQAVRRAGRRLPRRLRAQAQTLIEAERLIAHPRLMHRVDMVEVERAYADIAAHLRTIDRAEERKTRLLNTAAGIAFKLLLIAVLVLLVLRWRGIV